MSHHRVYFDLCGFRLYRHHLGDYMRRWILRLPSSRTIRLHHILRSDSDRALHDHPFDFTSFILWGGYAELTPDGLGFYAAGDVIRREATALHRLIVDRPAWTLVFTGPRVRRWGFQTPDGWVYWRDFDARWAAP